MEQSFANLFQVKIKLATLPSLHKQETAIIGQLWSPFYRVIEIWNRLAWNRFMQTCAKLKSNWQRCQISWNAHSWLILESSGCWPRRGRWWTPTSAWRRTASSRAPSWSSIRPWTSMTRRDASLARATASLERSTAALARSRTVPEFSAANRSRQPVGERVSKEVREKKASVPKLRPWLLMFQNPFSVGDDCV